jgi:hypothetical protein
MPYRFSPIGLGHATRTLAVVKKLVSAGAVINGLAALTSALAGNTGWLTSPFLDSTIPLFEQGTLDQWWAGYIGRFWPLAAGAVTAAALLLPDILWRASKQGPDLANQLARIGLD